jgi:hypothetical protein
MGQLSKIDICPQASLAAIENAKWQVSAELSSELDNGKIGDALLLEANKADLAGNLPLAHSIASPMLFAFILMPVIGMFPINRFLLLKIVGGLKSRILVTNTWRF